MQYKVTIVIPTRNRLEKLTNCLESVFQSTLKNIEIIVIDDNSDKDIKEKFKKKYRDRVKFIENKISLGVGVNRTTGATIAKAPYVLFIDDDNVIAKDMIERLYKIMEAHKNICILMPLMFFKESPDTVFYSGCQTSLKTTFLKIFPIEMTKEHPFTDIGINTAPNVFMVRKNVGDEVEWFDAYLKGVYTDMDLFMRIKKLHKNYFIAIDPKAKDWHDTPLLIRGYRNDTYNNTDRMFLLGRNRGVIMKRYAKTINLIIFSLLIYPSFTLFYLYKILQAGSLSGTKAFLKGTVKGYAYILTGRN